MDTRPRLFTPYTPLVLSLACVFALALFVHAADEPPASPAASADSKDEALKRAGNEAVREHIEGFKGRGEVGDFNIKPLSPEDSLKAFTIAQGYEITCVAHEPAVRQPLHISFDERGRMWVVQYLQYPFPAGLKIVKYDEHLRAVFDKVPAPPGTPEHVKGADKITIHEDTDGDGVYDKHKTFVEGLNIATSVARGRGGVWVTNPPYLLFYPDKNNDDVPDGPPEVHLSGFGLEDTHAVMNSLHWGPDGWLYGAQGSTCWATVSSAVTKDVHFKGQAIWRYSPETKVFEVFAEGGGNTFCVEFDSKGRVYSGTNWGAVRGVHYIQGGRYVKGWGKHGPLMNPYSFGFFNHMPHEGYQPRFSHSLILYEGGAIPKLEGKMVSIIPLHNRVQVSEMIDWGSTYKTKDVLDLLTTKDRWFRPVDIKAGPDGAIYLADWYDTRLTHVDPRDTWDKLHGRIWRISQKSYSERTAKLVGYHDGLRFEATDVRLVDELAKKDKWVRQLALRMLADRKGKPGFRTDEAIATLRERLTKETGQLALDALWGLNAMNQMDDRTIIQLLQHKDADVRRAVAFLAGDQNKASRGVADYLEDAANLDKNPQVLAQLAATARRIPGGAALPTLWKLAQRTDMVSDPFIPLMTWWGVEAHADSSRDSVLAVFNTKHAWSFPMVRDVILPRLAQRYASDPTEANLTALASLLDVAPGADETKSLLAGVDLAFKGRTIDHMPDALKSSLNAALARTGQIDDPKQLILRLRAGDEKARAAAGEFILNDDPAVKAVRSEIINTLGQVGSKDAVDPLLKVASTSKWHSIRREALLALSRFDDAGIGQRIVAMYDDLPKDQGVRPRALDTLSKREPWALAMLKAVEAEKIPRTDVPFDLVERMKLHKDADITSLIRKLWGRTRATVEQRKEQIEKVRALLTGPDAKEGDLDKGKALFAQSCALCHKLHGEGAAIGPDLTGYERDNLDFMLLSIIDPSAAIREEFVNYDIETKDFQILSGFLIEQTPRSVTILDGQEGKVVVARDNIEKMQASALSRMPEKLLDTLSDQQVLDLFAYLRSRK